MCCYKGELSVVCVIDCMPYSGQQRRQTLQIDGRDKRGCTRAGLNFSGKQPEGMHPTGVITSQRYCIHRDDNVLCT